MFATVVDELDDLWADAGEQLTANFENVHDIGEVAHERGRLLIAVDIQRHDELGFHAGAC